MPGIEEGWDGERKAPWEPRSFTELSGEGSTEGEAKRAVLTARAALVSYRKSVY